MRSGSIMAFAVLSFCFKPWRFASRRSLSWLLQLGICLPSWICSHTRKNFVSVGLTYDLLLAENYINEEQCRLSWFSICQTWTLRDQWKRLKTTKEIKIQEGTMKKGWVLPFFHAIQKLPTHELLLLLSAQFLTFRAQRR